MVNGFPLELLCGPVGVLPSCPGAHCDLTKQSICIIPDLLQADGLFDLLIVVGILPAGGELLEGIGEDLALAVPGASDGFEQLEDWVAHAHVRTLSF